MDTERGGKDIDRKRSYKLYELMTFYIMILLSYFYIVHFNKFVNLSVSLFSISLLGCRYWY